MQKLSVSLDKKNPLWIKCCRWIEHDEKEKEIWVREWSKVKDNY